MDNVSANAIKGTGLLAERSEAKSTRTDLVCLNFKVPLRVRQQFKICAARQNLTMTELLLRLLDERLTADASRPQGQSVTHFQKEK